MASNDGWWTVAVPGRRTAAARRVRRLGGRLAGPPRRLLARMVVAGRGDRLAATDWRRFAARAGAVGFGLAVLAVGLATPGSFGGPLAGLLGLSALPPVVPGMVLAVAATAATAALWALPRQWPLVTLALTGPLFATVASGLCVVAATFVLASRYRRPSHLAGYLLAVHLAALAPSALAVGFGLDGVAAQDLAGAVGGAMLFVWPPLALGLWNRNRREALAALHDRAERLEREQAETQARTRIRERTRLAREMHDVVAHEVSLVVMHAGALEVNTSDPATAATAELIRATGARALTQLREVLGVLRGPDDEAPLTPPARLSDLDAVCRDSRAAGLRLTVRTTGHPRELPVLIEHTAHSIVLEGLTNVRKHAGAVAATVELDHAPEALRVTVTNAAPATPPEPLPGGLGLIGLRERVALVGGELTAKPLPDGGFTLSASLPTEVIA